MAAERQWGVTPAFSSDPPSAGDLKLNDLLVGELKAQNNFAPASDTEKREAIITKLKGLLRQMVQTVGKKRGLPQDILDVAGGEVYTYGSYRLGVYGPASDVDTLMVAPKHVSRDDFFDLMPDLLRQSAAPGEITNLVPVPGISTPIIKLTIRGVDIDLIFSSLQLSSLSDKVDLADDSILRGLDEVDRRCVNGTRVTNRILQLVPQTKTFRLALRAIKLWAQKRAIYGNIVGFPGGVAYAILVARVCQLYPKAVAPLLVQRFFFIIQRWNWPKPVFLQHKEESSLQLREWDPNAYRGDAAHLMPILTPAVPSMNTAHTVTRSTKTVMMREFKRAEEIIKDIYDTGKPWSTLFERHDFFTRRYKHYICVNTAAKDQNAHDAWAGLVQSRIKRLMAGIEGSDANSVELVQPFTKGFDRVHLCNGEQQLEKTLDGSLEFQVKATETVATDDHADVKAQIAQSDIDGVEVLATNGEAKIKKEEGPQRVYTMTYYIGIGLREGATALDISTPVQNFQGECTAWPGYDADMHSIRIKHIRRFARHLYLPSLLLLNIPSYDLPADVFVPGETKPVRPKKKPKATTNGASAADNKRSFSNSGLDDATTSAKRRQSANTTNGTAG
ncbi:polynucleotide adenylyltransferase [Friedmanniomyces endolithicus]|uniref:Poly(A) polymerase n=1 Tax=Friedmanniomyces endolithicus TaxID=329885 RepID=A0AAN6G0J0_9PEZI|nr:polynucleotide adenylyltransferase [Friedmanniomyces endolithicus]KAK0313006.1 polynucleotide adenylyltransferase [Friedmanniomyces endolithicus]KAK0326875.1 polynucleotide adenylyltransferase [Friedmanniomyces endolithicus]KAK1019292.1 polynucleotide adenylyltransferase [Friedmanniomyces endolithicus]